MAQVLWVGEKKSLATAVAAVLPGQPEFDWERKGLTYNRVGDHWFVWLDGHAFGQAMPDHYLPDSVPVSPNTGKKVWRKVDLPVIPKPHEWTLIPHEKKAARLQKLAELLASCDVVHHLGDAGTEGQLLVDEALEYYGNKKPVKRCLVVDPNPTKVREAVANLRDNNEPRFRGWHRWALARARYDWLVGLNGTRAMTIRGRELGYDGLLSVGSVKTPLLYIVRERDRAIENFKPIAFYRISATLRHANGSFVATWRAGEDQRGLDDAKRLVDPAVAAALAARLTGKPAKITEYAKAKKAKKPPLPMALFDLQIEAFRQYGYTAVQVLDAAQALYDGYKVATYPRTENRYLYDAAHASGPAIIAAVFKLRPDLVALAPHLDASRKSAAFSDKEMEGQEHGGIVPSVPETPVDVSKWSDIERNVFDLIVRSYLAQFAAPYEFWHTQIGAVVDGERFVAEGKTPAAQGWKAVFAEVVKDARDDGKPGEGGDGKQTLPVMEKGDSALCERCDQATGKTTPPERFDDGLLSEAMRNVYKFVDDDAARKRLKDGDGIGTAATQGPIVAELKEQTMLVPAPEKAKWMTSPAARTLIDALPQDVKDPAQAGVFKARLDQVERGELSFEAFIDETAAWITDVVKRAATLSMKLPVAAGVTICPKCNAGQLRRKEGDKGAFWFCTNWNREPDKCDAKFQDVAGKVLAAPIACPTCKGGELRWKKRDDRTAFWFCSNWKAEPKCVASFDDKLGKPDMTPRPKCPTCKLGELRKRTREDKSVFWSCSRWNADVDKCNASFDDKAGKPDTAPKPVFKCPKCQGGQLRSIRHEKGPFWGCNRYEQGCKNSYPDKAGRPDYTAKRK